MCKTELRSLESFDQLDSGIDYSLGMSNRDGEIHYSCISMNKLNSFIWDEIESEYSCNCPNCGMDQGDYFNQLDSTELLETIQHKINDGDYCIADESYSNAEEFLENQEKDFFCVNCKKSFYSEECYGDEPSANILQNEEITAFVDSYNDMIIESSQYVTRGQFASPCFPGGVYLTDGYAPNGVWAYCLPADYFENSIAPYPIWKLNTDGSIGERIA